MLLYLLLFISKSSILGFEWIRWAETEFRLDDLVRFSWKRKFCFEFFVVIVLLNGFIVVVAAVVVNKAKVTFFLVNFSHLLGDEDNNADDYDDYGIPLKFALCCHAMGESKYYNCKSGKL